MKWVKCLYTGGLSTITLGKIYEVLSIVNNNNICFINDSGYENLWLVIDGLDNTWFEDATAEVRNNSINQILDEVG